MSPLHQEFNGIRKTIFEDIDFLAPRLRYEDKREILASTGLLPYEALLKGYLENVIVFTIVNRKNIPVGIFGVNDCGSGVGAIWLLASEDLTTAQISFLRQCRDVVKVLNTKYKILWNFVDCRNSLHIKWLKWCGFKFINKQKYGVLNKPFYEFIRINNV